MSYTTRKDGRLEYRETVKVNGKSQRISVYGWTKSECRAKFKAKLEEIESRNTSCAGKLMYYGIWLDTWLDEYIAPNCAATTVCNYRKWCNKIKPILGSLRIDAITLADVQRLINDHAHLSPRSRKYLHFIIKSSLGQLVKMGILKENPADNVKLPKMTTREKEILTPREIKDFLEIIKTSPYELPILTLLFTGVRVGELCALQWRDYDGSGVHIRHSFAYVMPTHSAYVKEGIQREYILKEPKSESSRRYIPLPVFLIDKMNNIVHDAERAALNSEFIFSSNDQRGTHSIQPLRIETISNHIRDICEPLGKHITAHSLRATFATLGVQQGIDIKSMQALLGHSTSQLLLDVYAKHSNQGKTDAINTIAGIYEG